MFDVVDRGFRVADGWAEQGGRAAGAIADPHVLVLVTHRPDLARGVLAGVLVREDVVSVGHTVGPLGGLLRAEVRFASPEGAGTLAAALKHGHRGTLNPTVSDRDFDERFAGDGGPVFALDPATPLPERSFRGANDQEWIGPGWGERRPSLRKLCLTSGDAPHLARVVAAILGWPRALAAKSSAPLRAPGTAPAGRSFFARVAFVEDDDAGWCRRRVSDAFPEVHPAVQDDGWFEPFRRAAASGPRPDTGRARP